MAVAAFMLAALSGPAVFAQPSEQTHLAKTLERQLQTAVLLETCFSLPARTQSDGGDSGSFAYPAIGVWLPGEGYRRAFGTIGDDGRIAPLPGGDWQSRAPPSIQRFAA